MTIITNATLTSYTTPAVHNARGGSTAGSTTNYPAGTAAAVGTPTRAQLISQSNKIAGCTAVIYMPPVIAVATGGKIAYRLNTEEADQLAEILHWTPWVRGNDSFFEVFVKNV